MNQWDIDSTMDFCEIWPRHPLWEKFVWLRVIFLTLSLQSIRQLSGADWNVTRMWQVIITLRYHDYWTGIRKDTDIQNILIYLIFTTHTVNETHILQPSWSMAMTHLRMVLWFCKIWHVNEGKQEIDLPISSSKVQNTDNPCMHMNVDSEVKCTHGKTWSII